MNRKLVQQGVGGYTIYLPSKWIKNQGLRKGDDIFIEPLGSNLLIHPQQTTEKKEITLKLSSMTESSIRTTITNIYRKGYDKATITFEKEAQFQIIKNLSNTMLIGFEIQRKDQNICILESVTEPSMDQYDNILLKWFLSIQEMLDITKDKFYGKKIENNIDEIQERIQKYDNFCRRVLFKQKFRNDKTELSWTFLSMVNHGQREIYHLNKLLKPNMKISLESKQLLEVTESLFKIIKESYYKKDYNALSKTHDIEKNTIYKKGYSLLNKHTPEDKAITYHLLVCIREFYLSNSSLFGLLI